MIRDITIGQYYPADSVIHKLDPRTKLVGTIGFIVSVFLFHTFAGYAVATIFLAKVWNKNTDTINPMVPTSLVLGSSL